MTPVPIYTVQATTAPSAYVHDSEVILGRLEGYGELVLSPAVSVDLDGRVSATFQVDAVEASTAADRTALLSSAAGALVERLTVWLGEADATEAGAAA